MNPATTIARTRRRHLLRWFSVPAACLGVVAIVGAVGFGKHSRTVTVTHGPVPAPVLVDLGVPGNSVGDQRIFRFDAQSRRTAVHMDWIMTTTALDTPETGVEARVTSAVFAFGGLDDTLLLQGTGLYPGKAATFQVSATLVRAIIGGTGKYRGAGGWVESTHNADDSWTHVFHLT